jgi:HSP20 family protein
MFNNKKELEEFFSDAESFIGELINENFVPGKFTIKNNTPTDIKEFEEKFVIEIELAGFKKENISVEYSNSELLVKAVSKNNVESLDTSNFDYRIKERSSEDLTRIFNIPFIEDSTIEASFENGVLVIELYKIKNDEIKKSVNIK